MYYPHKTHCAPMERESLEDETYKHCAPPEHPARGPSDPNHSRAKTIVLAPLLLVDWTGPDCFVNHRPQPKEDVP